RRRARRARAGARSGRGEGLHRLRSPRARPVAGAGRRSHAALKLATAVLVAALACVPAALPARSPGPAVCGTNASRSSTYRHVIWIWMENRAADEIVGSAAAP